MHPEKPPPMSERPASEGKSAGTGGTSRRRGLGIYVHFPFCLHRCPYCSFTSLAMPSGVEAVSGAYVEQLLRELAAQTACLALPRPLVTSIYLGGGTPSLVPPRDLDRLLSAIAGRLPLASDLEITLESNPGTVSLELLRAVRSLGINRLSIGVQSLAEPALHWLGRQHDAAQARLTIAQAIRAGFTNLGADLIFGVPVSSLSEEVRAARTLLSLGVTHLSAYALSIEEGTPFFAARSRGELASASEARLARTFQCLSEDLRSHGWLHYEISNYCRPGSASRHNLSVWQGEAYLGLGVSATGTLYDAEGGTRRVNSCELPTYLAEDFSALDRPGTAATVERLSLETLFTERLMLGLRTARGIDPTELERELGAAACARLSAARVARDLAQGRLAWEGSRLVIPHRFWHLSDAIIRDLL